MSNKWDQSQYEMRINALEDNLEEIDEKLQNIMLSIERINTIITSDFMNNNIKMTYQSYTGQNEFDDEIKEEKENTMINVIYKELMRKSKML